MRPVELPVPVLRAIERHGEEAYPEECCGFLLGHDAPGRRTIVAIERAPNRVSTSRERRYVIEPKDLIDLERRLDGGPMSLLGIYHSHPDHPARPSTFDQEHAWPWFTYIVLGVESGRAGAIGAFELDAESESFTETTLDVRGADPEVAPP